MNKSNLSSLANAQRWCYPSSLLWHMGHEHCQFHENNKLTSAHSYHKIIIMKYYISNYNDVNWQKLQNYFYENLKFEFLRSFYTTKI